jgi:hypothetical protein
MRRRTWALVRMADVMFSHQVSLPNMIYDHDCDTELPQNMFDEEFGPDTKILPPSRPSSEPTPMSYMIAKIKLCEELGNILQATGRVRNLAHYDEILRFDAKLREVKAELPPHLRIVPLDGTKDPHTIIIARFNIDILYQKIMCLLHRKYVSRARHNPRYAHSRRSAIEASLETLRHLTNLHRETSPGARLASLQWYVTSIATKDFLLPAMLVVLELHYDNVAEAAGRRQDSQSLYFWTPQQRLEMISILESTRDIWKGFANTSMEAIKASQILDIMLEKIKNPTTTIQDIVTGHPILQQHLPPMMKADPFAGMNPADLQPEHSAAMTLGMLSGGMTPNSAAFNPVQSPGGTSYPMDLGLSPSAETSGIALDLAPELLGLGNNPGSPFSSMFNGMSTTNMDMTNFDWVSNPLPSLPLIYLSRWNTSADIVSPQTGCLGKLYAECQLGT